MNGTLFCFRSQNNITVSITPPQTDASHQNQKSSATHSHHTGASHVSHGTELRLAISERVKHEHQRLECTLINDVKSEMDKLIRYTDDQTKYMYLCSVVMVSAVFFRLFLRERHRGSGCPAIRPWLFFAHFKFSDPLQDV